MRTVDTGRHNQAMTLQTVLEDPAAIGTWTLVPDRSEVTFTNKTLWGLVPVKGRFTDVSGRGTVGAGGAIAGRLDIRAASLRTGIGKRDEHLRSADFFDADKYPEITVEVTGAGPDGDLQAALSIRGTTLTIPLTATVSRLDRDSVRVTTRFQVDRTRWGVSGNMIGMMPTTTTLAADAVFVKS